jgi:hypothetical protein
VDETRNKGADPHIRDQKEKHDAGGTHTHTHMGTCTHTSTGTELNDLGYHVQEIYVQIWDESGVEKGS